MNTPICDFAKKYAESESLRLHMPGHKGCSLLGFEKYDLTEIDGADSLYEASGIIAESERNVSGLFGCPTYYSTEGSSQCIRAMLYLAAMHAKSKGKQPHIAAGRNAHKAFLSAAALLDLEVSWIYPESSEPYLSCGISAEKIEYLARKHTNKITAVYLTSPDYLGNITELKSISDVCHKHDILLIVDNAHGAYLRFLPDSLHPMDMGADICCDSAHKTLPVLTGGAYLHLSSDIEKIFGENVKNAMAMFGSTSPSYLILQSLDAANKYLAEGYRERLADFCAEISRRKKTLTDNGFVFCGDEPMKLTIKAKKYGYNGTELGKLLIDKGIVCEFSDPDFLVLMLTPLIGSRGLDTLCAELLSIQKKAEITEGPPSPKRREAVMTVRQAAFSPAEAVGVDESLGRILASASVGCPPAVPILVCGEVIDKNAIDLFKYYGISEIAVVK